ncbi:MAG: hypothetical protein A2286_11290 [Gammaproteobacteria bacterium RIFOXYA12_FULL_61_12]|nr:MAG: hypothetical protein A2514_00270 [Gammaproteobacteria bacterium RIFOXYD12_FULL_61_37]OGT92164.1 MAG: hypothetical protein A2286_11290 [Gammaproteobacteria bacterium RIFOXYA12_FULL_61_12]
MNQARPNSLLPMGFALIAVALLAVIYYAPIWWVSLTAPNYPAEAFPDGVRIHFHFNGVFNGCKKVEKAEISEKEALDCVHEMDTINHYVGMYPIAAGGVVERALSPFLVSMLGVMVLGFACNRPRLRQGVLTLGFGFIIGWMGLTFYAKDGLKYQSEGYVEALITSMDQAAGEKDQEIEIGGGIVERLRAELAKSGQKQASSEESQSKGNLIQSLRITFDKDQERKGGKAEAWNGSNSQVMLWHYDKSLGRYFNNRAEIDPMVAGMGLAFQIVFFGIIGAMLLLIYGAGKTGSLLYWLLIIVPAALPVFFIIEYAAWLWWYGHSMNAMGAFTVKPFMPTVFGQGKVAQFATHSYPYWGFGMILVLSLVTAALGILRRKELRRGEVE